MKNNKLFKPTYITAALASRGRIYRRDLFNITRYGYAAPRLAERIWVDPEECTRAMGDGVIRELLAVTRIRDVSGLVIKKTWGEEQTVALESIPKIRFCIDHWLHGIPWEETGAYEYMAISIEKRGEHDGCRNMADVVERYRLLDTIFAEVKKSGRLKTRAEINPGNFRGSGEPLVHIGSRGRPFFEGEGGAIHRFAIAHILKITTPAQVGCVHVNAIPSLHRFRQKTG